MKNIHILPTDKPSRLVKFFTNKFHLCKEILPIHDEEQYQNIYITSDEEISVGTFVLDIEKNDVFKSKGKMLKNPYIKNIILTTDQDLIKDGVQAIDDEFLEWFVKNPSCEEVEIRKLYETIQLFEHERNEFKKYKIIIPKEEPKQDSVFSQLEVGKEYKQEVFELGEEPKQETTLEEAAERSAIEQFEAGNSAYILGFTEGFKKASERSYSEEDLEVAFNVGRLYLGREDDTNFEQLIEQLKNK